MAVCPGLIWHSLSTSWKAVPASMDVGKLNGVAPDMSISYSICRSANGLPVSSMTVLPSSVLVTLGLLLAVLAGPDSVCLLHGDAGHSVNALIGHVADLATSSPAGVVLSMCNCRSPAESQSRQHPHLPERQV